MYARHLMQDAKAWEHTRLINYTLYCANTTDKKKPTLQEYFPLLTDNFKDNKPAILLSEKERLELQDKAMQRMQMLQKK